MKGSLLFLLACVWPVAAADLTGKWDFVAKVSDGREFKVELALKDDGGKLAGTMTSPNGSIAVQDLQLNGDDLSYKVPVGDGAYLIKLKVSNGAMKGTATGPDGSAVPVTVTRASAAGGDGVAGKWKLTATSSGGREYKLTLDLKNEGGKLSGTMSSEAGTIEILEPKLEGKDLSFKLAVDAATYTIKLTVADASLKGSYTSEGGEGGNVTGTR